VIYSWEQKQRKFVENAALFELERRRLEAMNQAAEKKSNARLRAAGLDASTTRGKPQERRGMI
jgi:hypothetical protein